MSKQLGDHSPPSAETEEKPQRSSKPTPWDPFRHFVKTISPTQREQLLRLEIPLLPPEDFMDTGQFRALRRARLRKWAPAILGLSACVLLIVGAVAYLPWGRSPAASTTTTAAPIPAGVPTIAHDIAHTAAAPASASAAPLLNKPAVAEAPASLTALAAASSAALPASPIVPPPGPRAAASAKPPQRSVAKPHAAGDDPVFMPE